MGGSRRDALKRGARAERELPGGGRCPGKAEWPWRGDAPGTERPFCPAASQRFAGRRQPPPPRQGPGKGGYASRPWCRRHGCPGRRGGWTPRAAVPYRWGWRDHPLHSQQAPSPASGQASLQSLSAAASHGIVLFIENLITHSATEDYYQKQSRKHSAEGRFPARESVNSRGQE